MSQGTKAIVISSVSGGGKTTVIELLKQRCPQFFLAITATTRAPRDNEKDGREYYFYTRESFISKIDQGSFLEYAQVYGNYYGILAKPILEKMAQGISVILNIDVQGMQTVRAKLGPEKTITIFLMPPAMEVWRARLRDRGANTEEDIHKRMAQGQREMEEAKAYDHTIVNETLKDTLKKLIAILRQARVLPFHSNE